MRERLSGWMITVAIAAAAVTVISVFTTPTSVAAREDEHAVSHSVHR
jgi:hypothetical protein